MKSKLKTTIREFISKYFPILLFFRNNNYIVNKKKLGHLGANSDISVPTILSSPENIFIDDYVRIQPCSQIINYTEKFIVKKFTAIGANFTLIPGNHIPTVGIPQFILGPSHINDKGNDIIVGESVWIGANVTLLSGAIIGRGAVVGACSLVNKTVPPYAVVVGCPARIIATTFTIDQIIEHEKILYPKEERFSREYIEQLFTEYFQGKKAIGTSQISDDDKILLENMKKELNLESYE